MPMGTYLLLALAAATGAAMGDLHPPSRANSWAKDLQQDLIRLGHIDWKLRKEAAPLCPARSAATGIIIDYIGAYDEGDRADVREETGLGRLPSVISVIEGSPADLAEIRPGDEIISLNHVPIEALSKPNDDPALLADEIQERIASLPSDESILVRMKRDGRVQDKFVALQSLCAARTVLKTDREPAAYTDGKNIAVTSSMIRFSANDDELAFIVGHELAHVIAYEGMPAGLFGRRKSEDQADVLGAHLAKCSGFDVTKAVSFWIRYGQRGSLFAEPAQFHRAPKDRAEHIHGAASRLTCPIVQPSFRQQMAARSAPK